MIYLDTFAIVKLVRPEAESGDLVDWLNARTGQPIVTSKLTEVELPRALRRDEPARLAAVPGVLARLNRMEIDDAPASECGDALERSRFAMKCPVSDRAEHIGPRRLSGM